LALIEIRDVDKIYDLGEVKVEALRNASLTLEEGEYVALIGASGSGKSTLMNILGSLDKPTNGTYLLAGEEVSNMSRDERAKIRNERIGFVFQNFNLLARTPAIENVELPVARNPKNLPVKCSNEWALAIEPIIIPINFLAVSNNESRLLEHWSTIPPFFWQTNQLEISIPKPATI
jgi:ABC-type lipoprotein export system ATPase subunit